MECYLVEMLEWSLDKEQRKCMLLSIENEQLITGLVMNRILNADELQLKLLEFSKSNLKLKVVVYAMGFQLNVNQSSIPYNMHTLNLDYIVVDYFDE